MESLKLKVGDHRAHCLKAGSGPPVVLIPESRLAILPGYGHAPHEQNKEAFNRLLLDFFDHD